MKKFPLTIITGAAGMIGSCVVRYLNSLGISDLVLVDDLKHADKWKNLVGKSFVSLISKEKLFEWLVGKEDEVEAVIHLGACSDTMESNSDYLLENNYRYTIQLAEWALKADKRFIYASSAATYGDGSLGFSDNEERLDFLHPINMYAYSKHLVDLWMKKQGVLNRVVGLKYFNVFGPNEAHKGRMSSMVFKMTQIAQKEGVIRLYRSNDPDRFPDGEQQRDFIYVKDAARMTCAFLDPKYRHASGIYNIGRGEAVSWNRLAYCLSEALNQSITVLYVDMPAGLEKQYQNYTCADMTKFNKLFEDFPFTPIEKAVNEYVRNYLLDDKRW